MLTRRSQIGSAVSKMKILEASRLRRVILWCDRSNLADPNEEPVLGELTACRSAALLRARFQRKFPMRVEQTSFCEPACSGRFARSPSGERTYKQGARRHRASVQGRLPSNEHWRRASPDEFGQTDADHARSQVHDQTTEKPPIELTG